MMTAIPIGAWVRTKYRGEWEFSQIVTIPRGDGTAIIGRAFGPLPPHGTSVQTCVWKKYGEEDVLQARGKPIIYRGDKQ